MKQFLVIGIAILLAACVTQKRCNDKYPCPNLVKDSTAKKEYVWIQTDTVLKYLPGDSVKTTFWIHDTIYSVTTKHGRGAATAIIRKDSLTLNVRCREDSLMCINQTLKDSIIVLNNKTFVEEKKLGMFSRVVMAISIIFNILQLCIILFVVIKAIGFIGKFKF